MGGILRRDEPGGRRVQTVVVDSDEIQTGILVDAAGAAWSSSNPFPVSAGTTLASSVTESGANVTTVSQVLVAVNAARRGGYVQNVSDATIFYSYTGACTVNDFKLFPNQALPFQFGYAGPIYTGALSFIHGGSGNKAIKIVQA